MSRRAAWRWGLLLLAFAAGCGRCGGEKAGPAGAPSLLRRLPQGATAVVIAPDALALGEALKIVQGLKVANFAAAFQGFASAQEYADALVRQVGIDVRSAVALEKAGVDPKKGLAVVVAQDGDAWLVIGAQLESRVGATLRTLATERLGAGVHEEKDLGGLTLHTLSRAQGLAPRMGYVTVDGYVLVATDAQVAKLADFARLPEAQSLAKDAALTEAMARLPATRQVLAWVSRGSPALLGSPFSQLAASAALSPTGLEITVDAPATEALSAAALAKVAGPDLTPLLPADTFLVARYGGDPKQLSGAAKRLAGVPLMRALSEGGLDLDQEVLANLKGGVALGLALSPRAQLSQGMPQLDLRRTNPFSFVQLAAVGEAVDAAKVAPTLEKLAQLSPRFGAEVKKVDRDGGPLLFRTTYQAGEGVHFGARDARVAAGNPLERVEAVLGADGKAASPISDPSLQKVLADHAVALAVDLRKLSGQVRALPSEAWGIGGFAIKASTLRWLDATDDLVAFSASMEAKGQFVQGHLALSLQAPAAAPPGAPPK